MVESATIRLDHRYLFPPISNTTPVGRMLGRETGAGPSRLSPTSCRMNDIPIAVISGASRGALRKGRYATRSIVALRRPQNAIAARRVRPRPQITEAPELD